MELIEHNRAAWNRESSAGSPWATPVGAEVIRAAREGDWRVVLTPCRAVPVDWFGELREQQVLCLASGGGQQAPVLAAAGAHVVSFDLSDEQLKKDRQIAAGFMLTGFYEDTWSDEATPLNRLSPTAIATRATKGGEGTG